MNQPTPATLQFLDCTLEVAEARLRRGGEVINLRPKTLAVLAHLAERPGQLVTKRQLLASVWPETAVTEWVLTSCIKELRQALGDDARQPRIVETVHRRGYRFIATTPAGPSAAGVDTAAATRAGNVVARAAELAQLRAWLDDARRQRHQLAFVVGEPGLGKTTLLDLFVASLAADDPHVLVARGQCIDQHGSDEPYLPVLEALTRLCLDDRTAWVVEPLRRYAPSWLVQLIGVLEPSESDALAQRVGNNHRVRLWREFAAFLANLPQPLVLILEDLHWSDHATLQLLSNVALRHDPLRLLVLASYRPVEVALQQHPLKTIHHELLSQGACRDLWLQPFDTAEVAAFLRGRWGDFPGLDRLAALVRERTDGNPLFVAHVANTLVADGVVQGTEQQWRLAGDVDALTIQVPDGLRQMIATRFDRLADGERDILAAGSLVGRSFSSALVAAALDLDVLDVEDRLLALVARGQFVHDDGEASWPDTTLSGVYRFLHALYPTVIRERVAPARRQRLHRRIADRLESAYGERQADVATILAFHREAAGQLDETIPHLEAATDRALGLGAGREAVALVRHGIALLDAGPPSHERRQKLAQLCIRLGRALPSVQGYTQPEVEVAYERARDLSQATGDIMTHIQSLAGLATVYTARGKFAAAEEAARGVSLAHRQFPLPILAFGDHFFSGLVRYHTGSLTDALHHFEATLAIDDIELPAFSIHPRVANLAYLGATLVHLGFVERGRAKLHEALDHCRTSGRLFDRAFALQMDCFASMNLRDFAHLEVIAEEALQVGQESDNPSAIAVATVAGGVCIVQQRRGDGGLQRMRDGIDAYRNGGHLAGLPFLLCSLADGLASAGDLEGALLPLAEARAVATSTGEQRIAVELHRLEGDIRAQLGDHGGAERCLHEAVNLAVQQGARWWELRARTTWAEWLGSRPRERDRQRRALDALRVLVDSFDGGDDTRDMQHARRLLSEA